MRFAMAGFAPANGGRGKRRLSHPRPHNVDILKTGGHKVSALEIEEIAAPASCHRRVRRHGLPDAEWGERVPRRLVLDAGQALDLDSLRAWARERLAVHKIPSRLLLLDELPRNAMGK